MCLNLRKPTLKRNVKALLVGMESNLIHENVFLTSLKPMNEATKQINFRCVFFPLFHISICMKFVVSFQAVWTVSVTSIYKIVMERCRAPTCLDAIFFSSQCIKVPVKTTACPHVKLWSWLKCLTELADCSQTLTS